MQSVFTNIFLFPFLTAFVLGVLLTPLCIKIIRRFGILDDPEKHKHPAILHKVPIPRAGGIPLVFSVLLAGLIFLPITKVVIALFAASLLALVIGVLDDKYDISPYIRLLTNIIVALIVIGSGVGIPFITNPLGGILHLNNMVVMINLLGAHHINVIADAIALVWIVWVMNMLNWSKGVDGQMPGIVTISAIVIGLLSLRFSLLDTSTLISAKLSFIIAGSSLAFLLFNFSPAKIFPGYGATAIYMLLSVLAILSGAKLATAILVMGVPMTDGVFTVFRRIFTGHSPFWHDKKHLHHLLLHYGLSVRMIAVWYWIFSGVLGGLALILSSRGKLFAILMLIVLVGGTLLFLHLTLKSRHEKNAV